MRPPVVWPNVDSQKAARPNPERVDIAANAREGRRTVVLLLLLLVGLPVVLFGAIAFDWMRFSETTAFVDRAGVVRGTTEDGAGNPVTNVEVVVRPAEVEEGVEPWERRATSDRDGLFRLELPPSPPGYAVEASAPGREVRTSHVVAPEAARMRIVIP